MLSRRGFIVTGICSAISTSAMSGLSIGSNFLSSHEQQGPFEDNKETLKKLSYKTFSQHKGVVLNLSNSQRACSAEIVDVHDMNSDSRLEQFTLSLQISGSETDISGVYLASDVSNKNFTNIPMSLVRNNNDLENSRYSAVFSRINVG